MTTRPADRTGVPRPYQAVEEVCGGGVAEVIPLGASNGWRGGMRGIDERSGALFSYVDLEARVAAGHPLRAIREMANAALGGFERGVRRA